MRVRMYDMYVCMCVCVCVCMYAYLCMCVYVCMCVCMCMNACMMNVCMHVSMYACIHVRTYEYIYVSQKTIYVCGHYVVRIYVLEYCLCVCMHCICLPIYYVSIHSSIYRLHVRAIAPLFGTATAKTMKGSRLNERSQPNE